MAKYQVIGQYGFVHNVYSDGRGWIKCECLHGKNCSGVITVRGQERYEIITGKRPPYPDPRAEMKKMQDEQWAYIESQRAEKGLLN